MRVPSLSELAELPVDTDPTGGPGVVSVMAWAGDATVTLRWDETATRIDLTVVEGGEVTLTAARVEVESVDVIADADDRVEFVIVAGDGGVRRETRIDVAEPPAIAVTPLG